MNAKRHHTPEGVRDIINTECEQKFRLEETLQKLFRSFGYRLIETPALEYLDVFGNDIGTTPSRELFRFFDRQGETLVLRPDYTPSIARAVSRYYAEESDPVRLFYCGKTWVCQSRLMGRLTESTQIGAELVGDSSPDADAEAAALAIEALLQAGLVDFQVTMGHAMLPGILFKDADLDEETGIYLRELIGNRNKFGAEKLLGEVCISPEMRDLLLELCFLSGGPDILEKAAKLTEGSEAASAIGRLQEVYSLLAVYGLERYVSFDLGMTSSFRYYTGVIFRGYTYAAGDALIKGGRYDRLMAAFGTDKASVGFGLQVDSLMNALARQKLDQKPPARRTVVLYRPEDVKEAIETAAALRREGAEVEMRRTAEGAAMPEDQEILMEEGCLRVIRIGGGK